MATDKFSDNVNTKGKLAQGHSISSKIDFSDDEDWFKVNFKRGNTYEFILAGPGTGKGTLPDPALDLYNASGISVRDDAYFYGFDPFGRAHLVYTASTNGNYFIDAYSDSGSNTGSYNLKFNRADIAGTDGITDGTDTEGKIKVGQSKDGHLRFTDDDDWYAINLKANTSYLFDVHTQFDDNPGLTLTLRDAQGNVLDSDGGNQEATLGYTTGNSGGKFFLDVSSSSSLAYYNLTAGFNTLPPP